MQRRHFITLIGGAAAAWPLAARAQQAERMRRIGVHLGFNAGDPEAQPLIAAFQQGLKELGWTDGRNVRLDYHWATANPDRVKADVAELVQTTPDVILVNSTPAVRALQQATSTVPIVFISIADPIRSGFVASLAHPGGNITGLTNFEASMGGKWLQLLKELAPRTTRAALIFNPNTHSGQFFRLLEAAGPTLGVKPVQTPVLDTAGIERALASLGGDKKVGLLVMPDIFTTINRALIRENWPDVIRLDGSLKLGHLKAAGIMRTLQVTEKPTTLARALRPTNHVPVSPFCEGWRPRVLRRRSARSLSACGVVC